MALGTVCSRVLGFVRDAVFFAVFDRSYTDAFAVAFRLPNLFRRLVGEGAMAVAFVPVYVSQGRRRELAEAVMSALLAVTLTLVGLGVIFMPAIVTALMGQSDPLVVALARLMMGYLTLVSLYSFFTAVANSWNFFFLPAVAPALFNVCNILFFLWGAREGVSPLVPAWGVLVGGILQVSLAAGAVVRAGVWPRMTRAWRGTGFEHVLRSLGPSLLGIGVFQALVLINTRFAASLGAGAQSYLYAADRLLELPQSLIAVSLGSALLPRFSEWAASGDRARLLSEITKAVRLSLFLLLPASLGLFFLAEPIVRVLFERGHFGAADSAKTAQVVAVYAALLIFSGLSRIVQPVFYALQLARVPARVAFVVLFVHIAACWVLRPHLGIVGLALATSCSSLVNWALLQFFLAREVGSLPWRVVGWEILRWVPGLVLMGALCNYGFVALAFLGETGALLATIAGGAFIYILAALGLGSHEARALLRFAR